MPTQVQARALSARHRADREPTSPGGAHALSGMCASLAEARCPPRTSAPGRQCNSPPRRHQPLSSPSAVWASKPGRPATRDIVPASAEAAGSGTTHGHLPAIVTRHPQRSSDGASAAIAGDKTVALYRTTSLSFPADWSEGDTQLGGKARQPYRVKRNKNPDGHFGGLPRTQCCLVPATRSDARAPDSKNDQFHAEIPRDPLRRDARRPDPLMALQWTAFEAQDQAA